MFDAFNNAVPGGLYDAALGPTENHIVCPTCFLTFEDCPGHIGERRFQYADLYDIVLIVYYYCYITIGHIKLTMPVYNPLNFPLLYKILKHKCFNCHRFKGAAERVRRFQTKLQLVDRGELTLAMGLDEELSSRDGVVESSSEAESRKELVFEKYERFASTTSPKSEEVYGHGRQYRKEVVSEILKAFKGSRCENCGAHSPAIRKDGHTKIFQKVFTFI